MFQDSVDKEFLKSWFNLQEMKGKQESRGLDKKSSFSKKVAKEIQEQNIKND